ncbi:DUF4296 domain-containing protein [Chryseolinea sp. T2]|uniref:DUF4296 domain-containing protein n=1 Tax=Chryseolinea sp. T2 TaxID=3129255 RepID=UPI0030783FCB
MLISVNKMVFIPRVLAIMVASTLLLLGCSKRDKPKGLLGQSEMVRAMTEVYLVEQKVSTVGVSRDSTSQMFRYMSPEIFKKLGTSDSIFRLSFDYYMKNPVLMEEIYTALIDSLNLREQQMISNQVKK